MVFKRYIKRRVNGELKTFGPYYYENHRDKNGKVTSTYLGSVYSKGISEKKEIRKENKYTRKDKGNFFKDNPLLLAGVFILLILNIVNIMFLLQVGLTGKASLFVDSIPKSGDLIQGKVSLTMKQGELIPADTIVIIKNNEQEKQYLLKELLLSAPIIQGDFYMRDKTLTGGGDGFGEAGEKTVYPEVSFTMKITSAEIIDSDSPIESISETTIPDETNEPVQDIEITGQIINSFYSFFGLSGRAVSDSSIDSEIEAIVAKDKPYTYSLLGGQSIEIIFSSQPVKLTIENGVATVITDYSEFERGFGEEFLGEDIEFSFNLEDLGLVAQEGELSIKFIHNDIELLSANKLISGVVVESPIVSESDIIETTVQENAIVNEPVAWEKDIQLKKQGKVTTEIPKEAENIKIFESGEQISVDVQDKQIAKEIVIDSDAFQYKIEYETPAPIMSEIASENGKKIVVSSDIPYENVLVKVDVKNLDIENPEQVVIYSVDRQEVVTAQNIEDTDLDGVIDFIEWTTDVTENETFNIIVITKAYHLDLNKTFISDIYNEVYELDGVWSEIINNGEYVRVTFEQKLTKENDITVYPRIVSGNAVIEVYEINSSEKIAEFANLVSNDYNKIYLTNLISESQDVFDLRIVGGSVEFDYIIDPKIQVSYSGLESGTQSWIFGGSGNSERSSTRSRVTDTGALGGTYSAHLQDDVATSYFYRDYNLLRSPAYNFINLSFWYYPSSIDTGEYVQAFCDNTEIWRFTNGNHAQNSWYFASKIISSVDCAFDNAVRIRFTGNPGLSATNDDLWVDGINITGEYTNSPPTIPYIAAIPDQNPIEDNLKPVVFDVHISDLDGVADINDNIVTAQFMMPLETPRSGTCAWQNDISTNTANYSCTVNMQYYDEAGTWNILISAMDLQGASVSDNTRTFVYLPLNALVITQPATLNWPTLNPGQTNIPSNNDPTIIRNTGNQEGSILITAHNLIGQSVPSELINANLFRASATTGGAECSATQLQDSTSVLITGSTLARGLGATEEIYYCLTSVSYVSSQTYSTGGNSWILQIQAV